MASIFSRIVQGEIPCHKVAETNDCLAFLDVNPLCPGHVLVIPKKEVSYLFDLEESLYRDLFLFSKNVAHAIEACVPCKRIGVAVIGLEVPHAHIHLIPINKVNDINFSMPKLNPSNEELSRMATLIRGAYGKRNS